MVDSPDQLDDQQLLHHLCEGGAEGRVACARPYRMHLTAVRAMLFRLDQTLSVEDRDDLAQQVFAELWRNRAPFRSECSIGHYLIGIAANLVSKHHRSETRRKRREAEAAAGTPLADDDDGIKRHEAWELAEAALRQLPDEQRQAVELVHLQERKIAEAAKVAGCSTRTMKHRLQRGKAALEQHLRNLE